MPWRKIVDYQILNQNLTDPPVSTCAHAMRYQIWTIFKLLITFQCNESFCLLLGAMTRHDDDDDDDDHIDAYGDFVQTLVKMRCQEAT